MFYSYHQHNNYFITTNSVCKCFIKILISFRTLSVFTKYGKSDGACSSVMAPHHSRSQYVLQDKLPNKYKVHTNQKSIKSTSKSILQMAL